MFVTEASQKTDILCAFFQHILKVNPMPFVSIGVETRLWEKEAEQLAPGLMRVPFHILLYTGELRPKL